MTRAAAGGVLIGIAVVSVPVVAFAAHAGDWVFATVAAAAPAAALVGVVVSALTGRPPPGAGERRDGGLEWK